MNYWYTAHVLDVYDGDTITVNVDLGFGIFYNKMKLRLAGINTPEVRGEGKEQGIITKNWLQSKILNRVVKINTVKDVKEKYGRYLAYVYLGEENLNESMIAAGLASPYNS
jgi:micrococcal nuclease